MRNDAADASRLVCVVVRGFVNQSIKRILTHSKKGSDLAPVQCAARAGGDPVLLPHAHPPAPSTLRIHTHIVSSNPTRPLSEPTHISSLNPSRPLTASRITPFPSSPKLLPQSFRSVSTSLPRRASAIAMAPVLPMLLK